MKMWSYLHWGVRHESGLVSMWLWFKRYRTLVSFILSPQGFKSTIYMAWLRLFRSHFAVYYRGPTLCCFTRPPPLRRRIFFPPIVLLIAWQNYFSHNLITFGQWVAIVPVKMWSDVNRGNKLRACFVVSLICSWIVFSIGKSLSFESGFLSK